MILGIDLGTSKSVVGIWLGNGISIIPDKVGHQSIPSLVLVTSDERILVGETARRHREFYSGKSVTVSSVKRLMGRKGETGWGWWKTYPQEVSALILAELKNQAEEYLGEEVKKAVIAIPSHFDESQRRATKEAAEIAGLEVVSLLNEANAAAIAYGLYHAGKDEKVLVFDFGGGTLDVSILNYGGGVYEVKCIEGDSKLGGDDFDQAIIDYILESIKQQYGTGLELNLFQKRILKEAAEKAKVELSNSLNTTIHIPGFLHINGRYNDLDVLMERKTFELRSKNLFDRAFEILEKALKSSGLKPNNLDALLLLGGTSRIPYIKEMIRKNLHIEPYAGLDPETCVAQGAVLMGGILEGRVKNFVLVDVVSTSYGVGLQGDIFDKLIAKNSPIPTTKSKTFTTSSDNQNTISIQIYQGEHPKTSENLYSGIVELTGILPAKAGIPKIEVTFNVDENAIVHVSAKDLTTGRKQNIIVNSPYGLNDAQIKLMKQKLKFWASERHVLELKYYIDSLKSSIEELIKRATNALEWSDIMSLKKCIESLDLLAKRQLSYKETEDLVSSIRLIYERALQKISGYERKIKDVGILKEKIEKFIPILKPINDNESDILDQGRKLLEDALNQNMPLEMLEKVSSTVRLGYEETKIVLIVKALNDLANSEDLQKWLIELETKILNYSSLRNHLLKLNEIKEIDFVINLLRTEDAESQKSPQQNVINKIKENSVLKGYFFLIIFIYFNFQTVFSIEEFLRNEEMNNLSELVLLYGLDKGNDINQRENFAKAIAEKLSVSNHFPVIVDIILTERDEVVKHCLLNCLDRQPQGVLQNFFSTVDSGTKLKISKERGLLIRLAKESGEETVLFALKSLVAFYPEEAFSLYTSSFKNKNLNIRIAALQLLISVKNNPSVFEIINQALGDASPEIQLKALEFINQNNEVSFIPYLLNLLQSEKNQNIKEKIIITLGNLENKRAVYGLFKLLMDKDQNICNLALSSIEKNLDLMDKGFKKLFDIIIKVTHKKSSLSLMDKFFLRGFSKTHPEISEILQILKNYGSEAD